MAYVKVEYLCMNDKWLGSVVDRASVASFDSWPCTAGLVLRCVRVNHLGM